MGGARAPLLVPSHAPLIGAGTNPVLQLTRKVLTVGDSYDGERFFSRLSDGTSVATPLLLALIVIEVSGECLPLNLHACPMCPHVGVVLPGAPREDQPPPPLQTLCSQSTRSRLCLA